MEKNYNLLSLLDKQQERELIKIKCNTILEQTKKSEIKLKKCKKRSLDEEIELLKLEDLNEQERVLSNRISEFFSSCDHELILYLGKNQNVGYGICLECEAIIKFDEEEILTRDNVINIEGIIPSIYIWQFSGNRNILAIQAVNYIMRIAETISEISLDELKQNILENLVYYVDELESQKIKPRKRKRIFR